MKSRPARCAMLSTFPVSRLSIPTTDQPRSSSASDRCDPMKPAAPVMTALGILESRTLQTANDGQPHDFDVETDRPVLDVVEIVLDALLERRVAAPSVDLGPAGDSRLDLVAQHVLRDAVLELLDEVGTFWSWSDDRHVAAQHVPELRQLVEVEPAQEAADPGSARVVVSGPDGAGVVFRAHVHRAELVDVERLAVETHPLLLVEHRAGRSAL